MTAKSNPLKTIQGQKVFYAEIEDIIKNGIANLKDDTPPKHSSFLNLYERAVPHINVDNYILKDYVLDLSWLDDLK
jgi:hypothetical protein